MGCTGYDAPVHSLERKLLRRSIQLHQNLYRSFGLSHEHINKCGSIVVAWTPEELHKLKDVVQENKDAGDTDVQILSKDELLTLEPSLSTAALGGVLLPREAVVEPWLVPIGYALDVLRRGVKILTNEDVCGVKYIKDANCDTGEYGGHWRISMTHTESHSVGRSLHGEYFVKSVSNVDSLPKKEAAKESPCPDRSVRARIVINCAGLFGDEVENMRKIALHVASKSQEKNVSNGRNDIHDRGDLGVAEDTSKMDFKICPRKGQFIVFKLPPEHAPTHIIEPVANQFTKGVIVWTTVYGNVIVGPTAVDVSSKTDRSTDGDTIAALQLHGEKVVPNLKYGHVIGTYSGIRPATQYRDYQIVNHWSDCPSNEYANSNTTDNVPPQGYPWITVGGIRSTGLSASSGIGEYVCNMVSDIDRMVKIPTPTDTRESCGLSNTEAEIQTDGLIGVTDASMNPVACIGNSGAKLPSLDELGRDYRARNEMKDNLKYVEIDNQVFRVTHPISSFGLESYNVK